MKLRALIGLMLLGAILAGCGSGGGNTEPTPDNANSAPTPGTPTQPSGS